MYYNENAKRHKRTAKEKKQERDSERIKQILCIVCRTHGKGQMNDFKWGERERVNNA